MYVGVDLEAAQRKGSAGLRIPKGGPPSLDLTSTVSSDKKGLRRSSSFTPPSQRLTQPTKSSLTRTEVAADKRANSPQLMAQRSARDGGHGTSPATPKSPASGGRRPQSARSPQASGRSPFGTPGGSSSRSRPTTYSARLASHEKTHSPSGRFHPDSMRRREIRSVDMHTDVDYFAAGGAPDNDRTSKESSWLCSQAFIESLRVYPDPYNLRPIKLPGEAIAFSGNTQSARRPHVEHLETGMRRRLDIAPQDQEWLPDQCPQPWPFLIPEGKWQRVGPMHIVEGEGGGGVKSSVMGRFFRSRNSSLSPGNTARSSRGSGVSPTGGDASFRSSPGSSRFAASAVVGEATSPAGGGMSFFNR